MFLVTFVTVVGTSAKDSAVAQLNQLSTADFTITLDGEDLGSTSLSTGDLDELPQAAGIDLTAGTYEDLEPGAVVLLQSQVAIVGPTCRCSPATSSDG